MGYGFCRVSVIVNGGGAKSCGVLLVLEGREGKSERREWLGEGGHLNLIVITAEAVEWMVFVLFGSSLGLFGSKETYGSLKFKWLKRMWLVLLRLFGCWSGKQLGFLVFFFC